MAVFTYQAPVVGGSENTWGTTLNQNWADLSTFLGSLDSAELAVLDGITASTAELNILVGVTADASEINLLDGVTATTAEINYVSGVTSAIQTQLDAKAADTTQAEADWETGTSTTESLVSPAKVKASVIANTVNYTQPTTTGDVGTYAFLGRNFDTSYITAGSDYSGSVLRYATIVSPNGYNGNTILTPDGSYVSGTWRAMGSSARTTEATKGTVFLRIS